MTRMKRLGAFCSSMPALCSRNTKEAEEPSRMGSMDDLEIPAFLRKQAD